MSASSPASEELTAFIAAAKASGIADSFIVALLRKNGWSEQRVYKAFSTYYTAHIGVAIPAKSGQGENARDAFFYLLNFVTLGFWTTALGSIFYTYIAHVIPDATGIGNGYPSLRDQIAWQLATVLVTFPIFAFVHRLIAQQLAQRTDGYDSGVRKWLTYIALVIAALVVVLDAIWFLDSLFRGQLTLRFILDSLVLLVLGGGVFAYYLATIDGPRRES